MASTPLQPGMVAFIAGIPKAELHLHLEGTLEPEFLLTLADRNRIKTRYQTPEQVRAAYAFHNLQEFLNLYYEGTQVLVAETDFYELAYRYLRKAHEQNVLHAEIHFDPQTHTARGIRFAAVIEGIHSALVDAERDLGISARLILCFLRHLDEKAAFETLEAALPYRQWITAVGLDSSEMDNPPVKFASVFRKAREAGFSAVAHAGEEGPASYVRQALELLDVARVDHGNRALEDPALVSELARRRIPLTICPLSNLKLRVVDKLAQLSLKRMMEQGLVVTVNSDDPAYFGGYVNENYTAIAQALRLSAQDISVLARNSIISTFAAEPEKARMVSTLEAFLRENPVSARSCPYEA